MLGFWLFMLIMTLLTPSAMLFFGKRFSQTEPEKINFFYGYRTQRSMKNRETWEFAHRCCGRYWLCSGKWTLAVSLLVMVLTLRTDLDTISEVGAVVVFAQMIPLLIALPVTERALKRNFDVYGNRIELK